MLISTLSIIILQINSNFILDSLSQEQNTILNFLNYIHQQKTIWKIYEPWFITLICVSGISFIIYPIVMFINDFELGDLEELSWLWCLICVVFVIIFPITIWRSIFQSNWIILSFGFTIPLSILVNVLIWHFIKFIIETISFGGAFDWIGDMFDWIGDIFSFGSIDIDCNYYIWLLKNNENNKHSKRGMKNRKEILWEYIELLCETITWVSTDDQLFSNKDLKNELKFYGYKKIKGDEGYKKNLLLNVSNKKLYDILKSEFNLNDDEIKTFSNNWEQNLEHQFETNEYFTRHLKESNNNANSKSIKANAKNNKANQKDVNSNKKVKFEDIAGLEDVKKAFYEKVILPIRHKELFEKFNKRIGGGILIYGPPGTGKTLFAEAAANEIDAAFYPIKCSDIKSKWYGESEGNIKNLFQKARKNKISIIFMDEFEAIGSKRVDNSDNGNNDLVPEILAQIQGINNNHKKDNILILIAATNRPWAIDSAFLRPGRFDEKIYVGLPDYEARKFLFKNIISKIPHNEIDFDYLSKITENNNGADIVEFCEKLKMEIINKVLKGNEESILSMNDVYAVEKYHRSSIVMEDIHELNNFQKKYQN